MILIGEFYDVAHFPETGFYTLKDLMADCFLRKSGDLKEIFHISVKAETPLALKEGRNIQIDPQRLDFDLFLRGYSIVSGSWPRITARLKREQFQNFVNSILIQRMSCLFTKTLPLRDKNP